MRFTTGIAIAAALVGADARVRHDARPYGNPFQGGWGWGSSSSVAASAAPSHHSHSSHAASTAFATATATVTPSAVNDQSYSRSSKTSTATASATSAASTSGSGSLTTDEQNALDAHNSARSDVGTAALTWDSGLAAEAQTWAETIAAQGSLEHSSTSDEGENLYMGYDSTPYTSAVAAWVDEKSSYSGEAITSTNYMTFGHYTQVVWKDTTAVGMGSATGSDGATYVVARYAPAGNYVGETAY
ncbi:SCP-like extracellular protein [Pestalotiopsis sp. NC0098]|nr:SCP-like extracellular protein [Pestalotiopsis sp. NC0098]